MKIDHFFWVLRNCIYNTFRSFMFAIPVRVIRTGYLWLFAKEMGKGVYVGKGIDVRDPWNISIGDDVVINKRVLMDGRGGLIIASHVDIAQDANIWTESHDYNSDNHALIRRGVLLGHHSWIGAGSTILPGVTIGEGAVVGTCACVTKNVAPLTVVAGIPARKISDRENDLNYTLNYNPRFYSD